MTTVRRILIMSVAVVVTVAMANAGSITGSLPLAGFSVTENGADLSVSTLITADPVISSGPGAGDFSVVPVGSSFGAATLDLTNLSGFTFTNPTFGTFTGNPAYDALDEILTQTASNLDIFIVGDYTGLTGACGSPCASTESSLRFSVNQSGSSENKSLSEAITLNSPDLPPPGVPEPATTALLGTGLAGLALLGRKRSAR